jgi:hypothetical protein
LSLRSCYGIEDGIGCGRDLARQDVAAAFKFAIDELPLEEDKLCRGKNHTHAALTRPKGRYNVSKKYTKHTCPFD